MDSFPNGWLAFELSVLRRLKFSSIALPFTGDPDLCVYLKRWKVRGPMNLEYVAALQRGWKPDA